MPEAFQPLTAPTPAPQPWIRRDELSRVILKSIGDSVITTDIEGAITYLNPSAERLTGWTLEEARTQRLEAVLQMISEATRQPVANMAARCVAEDRALELEDGVLLCRRDGSEIPIGDSTAPVRSPEGTIIGVVLVIQDESEKRRVGHQLSHEATHDPLTGLLNRRGFEGRLTRLTADIPSASRPHALLYLDLDGFKSVNDTMGHQVGDDLLCSISAGFGRHMRDNDSVARLGGDEFGILLENCPLAEAKVIAGCILTGVATCQLTPGSKLHPLRASIGLTQVTAASGGIAASIKAADDACYRAKNAGGNQVASG